MSLTFFHSQQIAVSGNVRQTFAALVLLTLLAGWGCGGTDVRSVDNPPPAPTGYPGVAISGAVLAGSHPLSGSGVQLYAAGTTGSGSVPTSLGASATTDSSGAFAIPAGYTCPAASSQLYVVARGGAVANAASDTAIALVAMLGRCDQVAASTRFVLNEVTTAATAWALSQFLSSGAKIGSTATNPTGLASAVAGALSLAGNTTGASPGPDYPANGTSPAPRINSLANLLALCTGADGSVIASCARFLALTSTGGVSANDTLDAAFNLVRSPGANVSALFNLAQSSTAFAPALASAPADWTLPLTFTGGGMNEPGPMAIDSNGNVWVASYFGVASQFSTIGAPTFASGITGSGLSESYGLAIDPSNDVWITDENSPDNVNGGYGAVTVLNSNGQPLSGAAGFSSGGLNYPLALAIDPNGATWVVDYGNSHLTQLNPSGQPLSGASGYFSNLFVFPVAIALDASHTAWVANMSGNSIIRVSPDGQQFTDIACCDAAAGLALDAAGNVWVSNYLGDSVSEVSSDGAVLSSGYTGGGIFHPQGIAIDGNGTVWVSNFRSNSISELAGANSAQPGEVLSPTAGWAPTPTSLQAFAIAIDASGNLWFTNFSNNSITKIVGLATPVKTPLSALPKTP